MSSGKRILENIHPLHLIREIKKRPSLYDKQHPDRWCPTQKAGAWHEVGEVLFEDWNLISTHEKECRNLAKKWRNLRDTFKRYVEVENKIRAGHNITKKRYVYYRHMLFLVPHLNTSEAEPRPEFDEEWQREGEVPSLEAMLAAHVTNSTRPRRGRHAPGPRLHRAQRGRSGSQSAASTVLIEEIDEDKTFLLSLIPSFKRMTDDQKLTLKVEILQLIKKSRRESTIRPGSVICNYEEVNVTDPIKKEMFNDMEVGDEEEVEEEEE